MNHTRITSLLAALALALTAGCADESTSAGSTPDIQSRDLAQLSAGGGIAGYDFYIDIGGLATRVGTLIVTNGAYDVAQGYYDQMEYWRWDPTVLADIETGAISDIDVDFVGTSSSYSATLVGNFESGTGTWTAWDVNRLFNLSSIPSWQTNNPGQGRVLYTMEADAWGGEVGSITYYLKMDFTQSLGYPEMYWYVSWIDFTLWADSEAGDGDSDSIYEVRLTDDSDMTQTSVGVGYELKTVK